MKVRSGFVSNSSSSSFVIASKKALSYEMLMEAFAVPENSPLFALSKEMAQWFIENAEKVTVKEYLNRHDCGSDDDEIPEIVKKAIKQDLIIYEGYASNDNGYIEEIICDMDLNHETDGLIIEKEGGY